MVGRGPLPPGQRYSPLQRGALRGGGDLQEDADADTPRAGTPRLDRPARVPPGAAARRVLVDAPRMEPHRSPHGTLRVVGREPRPAPARHEASARARGG